MTKETDPIDSLKNKVDILFKLLDDCWIQNGHKLLCEIYTLLDEIEDIIISKGD